MQEEPVSAVRSVVLHHVGHLHTWLVWHVYGLNLGREKDRVFVILVAEDQSLVDCTGQHPLQWPEGHTPTWITTTNVRVVTKEPGLQEAGVRVCGVGIASPQCGREVGSTLAHG